MRPIYQFIMTSLLTEISCMHGLAHVLDKGKEFDTDRAAKFIIEFQLPMLDESSTQTE